MDFQSSGQVSQGQRFKRLRLMTGLNQAEFAQALGYSRASINYWENASNGGLTSQGAKKTIEIAEQHGVICSLDWLLLGIGLGPQLVEAVHGIPNVLFDVQHEVSLFKKHYSNSVIYKIENEHNCFSPFSAGDILAGVWIHVPFSEVSKKEVLALVEDAQTHSLMLGYLEHESEQQFKLSLPQLVSRRGVRLEKFIRIIRWWGK